MNAVRHTRIFKSGNSKAVRLPAEWALEPGQEVIVREEDGRYIIEPATRAAKARTLDDLYGAVPGIRALPPEDRALQERDLPWHLLGLKLD